MNRAEKAGRTPRPPLTSFLFAALSLLLLPRARDGGVGSAAAAFSSPSRRRRRRRMPTWTRAVTPRAIPKFDVRSSRSPSSSSSSSSSALFYRSDDGAASGDDDDDDNDDGEENNAPGRQKQPPTNNKSARKKKKMKKMTLSKSRSHQLYKRGMQAAPSEEELAHHVQSIFSSEFGVVYDEDEEEEEEEGVEPFILSDPAEEEEEEEASVEAAASAGSASSSRRRVANDVAFLDRHPSLVLNADYQPLRMLPLSIWSWQDTVKAVLSGKAVVVDMYPGVYVRAVSIEVPVPSVIALREYAPTGKARPAFTRRNVFLRDGYRCQYCGGLFRTSDLSLDHVEPRCLGGRLTWENTATCCKRCNGRKGSLRPSELHRVGMVLRSKPRCPTLFELAAEAAKFVPRRVHPTWAPFLGGMSTKSAAVAVASSSSPLSSSGGGYDDGANGGGGDGRKRMKKYRPYE